MDFSKIFRTKVKNLPGLTSRLERDLVRSKAEAVKRMNLAVNIVYKTASAKRPMIGRKGRRVSDPKAPYGVPVAEHNGGRLKASIKHEVVEHLGHITGRIWVDEGTVPYARRIEYGFKGVDKLGRVYNQEPRPFMRPAWDLNKQTVHKVFNK